MPVYYNVVYSHLQYGIILWGNTTKSILTKLQIKQIRIIELICYKSAKRLRLKRLYHKLHLLNINGIYKLELAKFILKAYLNKFCVFCSEYLISVKSGPQYICIQSEMFLPINFIYKEQCSSKRVMSC